eukprot:TRINITY_DN878_c0_g1_i2.p1 TRINITY_DN878_c0_g1~~TRINITY_DN878_c0_g1_i2.p1  ORF type:complete len:412 (+),score=69.72 TRINITY_DN878_c0_g1_i2:1437-2672(+)
MKKAVLNRKGFWVSVIENERLLQFCCILYIFSSRSVFNHALIDTMESQKLIAYLLFFMFGALLTTMFKGNQRDHLVAVSKQPDRSLMIKSNYSAPVEVAAEAVDKELFMKRQLVDLIARRSGIFVNRALRPKLANTLMVTMANWGFKTFFFNWACFSKQIGFDYIVLSMDPKLHNFLGESRSIQMDEVSGKQEWGTSTYFDIGCHKLEAIQYILELGTDVFFSDADNVIGRIPERTFAEMESGVYDVLIQADHPSCVSRSDCPPKWKSGKTANGGFYYFSARRKEKVVALLKRAVMWCLRKPREKKCCDDQQALNRAIYELNDPGLPSPSFPGAEFCSYEPTATLKDQDNLQYCVMDPVEHPAGRHDVKLDKIVSLHANWILDGGKKIEKLQRAGLWQWDGLSCTGDSDPS